MSRSTRGSSGHFVSTAAPRPWGIDEVSAPAEVPAVLNAIYAANGKRPGSLPIEAALSKLTG